MLADPSVGRAGDANRDGRPDPYEDEFIELYNAGPVPVSLAGWRLGDAGSLSEYFRFPRKAVIAPRSYVVLFGGGNPAGFTVPVYTDDGKIGDGLKNSGEAIYLIDGHGDEVAFLSTPLGPPPNPSSALHLRKECLSRTKPPLRLKHPSPPESPQKRRLNQISPKCHPNPYMPSLSAKCSPTRRGCRRRRNRDGQRHPYQDEFIELYNADSAAVDIGGWRLGDAASLFTYFLFPPDAVIAPGSYVVSSVAATPPGSPSRSILTTELSATD